MSSVSSDSLAGDLVTQWTYGLASAVQELVAEEKAQLPGVLGGKAAQTEEERSHPRSNE